MSAQTLKIINQTKGTILAEKAEIADAPFERLKGLLGRTGLGEGEGMVITPCNSIHTFFMRFNIDVVFLDKHDKVVSMAKALPPARLFGALPKGKLVIELPSGTLNKTMTATGDQISMEKLAKNYI